MAKQVIIEEFGGPRNMKLVDVEPGEPGPGEVRIQHEAIGLNFIDVYFRTGTYPMTLPAGLGMEAAGVIEAVGAGVTHLKPGDRAAYAAQPPGAYATERVMPAPQVVPLPDDVSFETAAAAPRSSSWLARYPAKSGARTASKCCRVAAWTAMSRRRVLWCTKAPRSPAGSRWALRMPAAIPRLPA